WTPNHPLALVALVPCHATVIGNEQRAVRRFDETVNTLGIRGRDCDRQTPIRLFWKTFVLFRSDFRPRVTAVGRAEQTTRGWFVRTGATGAIFPALAAKIPHASQHDVGISRIESDRCATGGKIRSF